MKNRIQMRRSSLRHLLRIKTYWGINTDTDWHGYQLRHAVECYRRACRPGAKSLGSVLAVCANQVEARILSAFPFDRILLTGIVEPGEVVKSITEEKPNITYQIQNCEALALDSRSFDLVLCKEGLHHLARPVQGLYEMLRVCRDAVVIMEPNHTMAGRILQILRLGSVYETNQQNNLECRDNFVYRWSRRQLESISEQLLP